MVTKLARRVVEGDAAVPTECCVWLLHGALGSGQNWVSFARRLVAARPGMRCVLPDLRCHGGSVEATPPHTLEAAAQDLEQLAAEPLMRPHCVIGHSFGGKVALLLWQRGALPPARFWALDALPGSAQPEDDGEIGQVIRAMSALVVPAASRAAAVGSLVASGLSTGLAQWLATNLKRAEEGYRWAIDLEDVRELMADYFRVDLWGALAAPLPAERPRVVVAERSDRWTDAFRERAQHLAGLGRLHYHDLPNAGHWVHVDNPSGLLELLLEHLP